VAIPIIADSVDSSVVAPWGHLGVGVAVEVHAAGTHVGGHAPSTNTLTTIMGDGLPSHPYHNLTIGCIPNLSFGYLPWPAT